MTRNHFNLYKYFRIDRFNVTTLIRNNPFPTFYYLGLTGIHIDSELIYILYDTFKIEPNECGGIC